MPKNNSEAKRDVRLQNMLLSLLGVLVIGIGTAAFSGLGAQTAPQFDSNALQPLLTLAQGVM